MNYLKEIVAFHDLVEIKQLSAGQIALWYALIHINNKTGWKEWFTVSNRTLESYAGLSRKGVQVARNALMQNGFIQIKFNGKKATAYKIVSNSAQDSTQVSTQVSTQDSTQVSATLYKLNKTKQKIKRKNNKKEKGEGFDRFWKVYPRKDGKAKAIEAWGKLSPNGELTETIIAALIRQI